MPAPTCFSLRFPMEFGSVTGVGRRRIVTSHSPVGEGVIVMRGPVFAAWSDPAVHGEPSIPKVVRVDCDGGDPLSRNLIFG